MHEDALSFPFLGSQVYAYGLLVMLGVLLALGLALFLTRKNSREQQAAALTALLALPLGLILARLMYVFLDPTFRPLMNISNILNITTGGLSMFGALIGAALAACIAARLTRVPAARMLDVTAAALLAFLIPARLGEGYTALGVSRPLTTQWLADSFLARQDDYDAYLRTYLLEAVIALILLVILLRFLHRKPRHGRAFAMACLLFGITQTLMESLRYDGHMRFSFIGVQQVLAVTLFCLVLIVLAIRLLKANQPRLLAVLSLIAVPLSVAGGVGVEFLIDRSEMGKLISYALYLLVLAIPAALGILMLKQEERLGQSTD